MAQFESVKDEVQQAGAQLVYVAGEKRQGMFKPEQYLVENPISFPFLLDEDRSVIKACGLYHRLGTDAINIAHPATLIVNRYGTIQFIYRGADQHDRMPVAAVLEILKKVGD